MSTAAFVAAIGLSFANHQVNAVQIKESNKRLRDINLVALNDDENKDDDIASSSTDAMLAFSQISANDSNPQAVIGAMEEEIKNAPKKENNGLGYDDAVAAYAEFMSGEGSETVDPAKLAAEKKKAVAANEAKAQLASLQDNDATSAFAGLIEAQQAEDAAEQFKGSAPEDAEEEEAVEEKPKVVKKKAAPKKKAPAKKPAAKKPAAKKKEGTTHKKEEALVGEESAGTIQISNAAQVKTKKSKLQSQIDLLKAGKSIEDVNKVTKSKKGATKETKTSEAKAEPAADAAPEQELQVATSADASQGDAAAEAQAQEIVEQIKAASADMKSGDVGDLSKVLDSLEQGGVLLQLESDIQMDPDAEEALGMLANQFPEEYPETKDEEVKPVLTKAQKEQQKIEDAAQEKQDSIELSKHALDKAAAFIQEKDDADAAAAEKKRMAEEFSLVQTQPMTGATTLAQTDSKAGSNGLSELGLDAEQLQYLQALNYAADEVPDDSHVQTGVEQEQEVMTESSIQEDVAQAADVVNNENTPVGDESLFDLKTQAVAAAQQEKAAEKDKKQDAEQEKQKQAKAKKAKEAAEAKERESANQADAAAQAEQDAKEAAVAQAMSANSAAEETGAEAALKPAEKSTPKPEAKKSAPKATKSKPPAKEQLETADSLNDDAMIKQQQLQYQSDKQSALDQGYTEEQAELYAKQEQMSSETAKKLADQEKPAATTEAAGGAGGDAQVEPVSEIPKKSKKKDIIKPAVGPTSTPPVIPSPDPVEATKQEAQPENVASADDLSQYTPEQIQQAQAQAEQEAMAQVQEDQKTQVAAAQYPDAVDAEKAEAEQVKAEQTLALAAQQQTEAAALAGAAPESAPAVPSKLAAKKEVQKAATPKQSVTKPSQAQKPKAAAPAKAMPKKAQPVKKEAPKKAVVAPKQPIKPVAAKAAVVSRKPAPAAAKPVEPVAVAQEPATVEATVPEEKGNAEPDVTPQAAPAAEAPAPTPDASVTEAPKPAASTAPVAAAPAAPKAQPAKTQKPSTKVAKSDKAALQETSDIHQESSIHQKNKDRAAKYEHDLNTARDQIHKAQAEMQGIDSEVQNFQQKMSKSMHSLMQAFNEGFEAMENAKKEEGQGVKVETKKNERRVTKMNKIHSGMANLEALTSKLKMSFGNEGNKDATPENKEDIQTADAQKASKAPGKVTAAAQVTAPNKATTPKAVKTLAKTVATAPAKAKAVPVVAKKAPILAKAKAAAPVPAKKAAPAPKAATPAKAAAQAATPKKSLAQKPPAAKSAADLKASMKAKMKAVLAASSNKQKPIKLAKKVSTSTKQQSKPVQLAQTQSSIELKAKENLASLLETQKIIQHITQSGKTNKVSTLAQSLGIVMSDDMKKEASKMGSNEVIAHTMAQRVLAQVQKGKSQSALESDLKKTKQSLNIAQKAFYDKDPKAIALLQLNDDIEIDNSTIYLETDQEQTPQQSENLLTDEQQTLNGGEEEIQSIIDKDN